MMPRFLPPLVVLFATVTSAQYEDLLKQADPTPPPAPDSPAAVIPPPAAPLLPRLLPPVLHKDRITHLDQSSDGRYLLTADAQVLRIWDVAHRAAIAEFNARPGASIAFACFTHLPRQVLIVHDGNLTTHDDFDFTTPVYRTYVDRNAEFAYHRDSNQLVSVRLDPQGLAFLIGCFSPVEGQRGRQFRIPLIQAYGADAKLGRPFGQNLLIDADARTASFRLALNLPMAVIDLASESLLTTISPDLKPHGMLPSGEILTQHFDGKVNRFTALDPSTGATRPLATVNYAATLYPVLPRRAGDPLLFTASPDLFIHDLASGTTSANFRLPDRRSDVAITLIDGPRRGPLVAQSKSSGTNSEVSATYLERFDVAAGVSRGAWSLDTFSPNAVYPRSDDLEFLVRRGQDLRRVRFTEAGLEVTPLDLPAAQTYNLAAYLDPTDADWRLVGRGKPQLATLGATESNPLAFTSRTIGRDGIKVAEPNVWSTFIRTLNHARSRDGRVLALHHGDAVQVIDTTTGDSLAVFTHRGADTYYEADQPPGLALSPDGKSVVFAYTKGQDVSVHCHDVATGEERWTTEHAVRDFHFNADGSLLFGRSTLSAYSWAVLYAETGERASSFTDYSGLTGLAVYNPAGTLLAVATPQNAGQTTVSVYNLPEGERVGVTRLAAPVSSFGFVGSDRFLLVNSTRDEAIRLINTRESTVVAEMYLFDSPQKWLVRHPATGLFSSETSLQTDLRFALGEQISPLESYFDEFYRPRLLGSLIQGLTPRPTVPLSDLTQAPKLTLSIDGPSTRGLSVEDEFETHEIATPEVTLRLDATCEGSPIADLRIYHNGKLVAGATRGLLVEDDEDAPPAETFTKTAAHTFMLTPGKNRFRAVALNAQGTESAPDELIVYSDATPPEDETAGIALHVVTVGIDAYRNPTYNLNYAVADARAVEATLRDRLGHLFTRAHHYALYDAQATRENILATLDTVQREAGPRDVFVFYYAGHGVMSDGDDDPEFYLAPHEITQLYGERRILRQLGIPGRDLLGYSRDIAAQKQLWVLDACQSAGALKNVAVRGAVEERAIAQLARSTGTHWLTSTGSTQFATEFAALGHGAFTSVLLDGLRGAADAGDGIVSVNEIKAYVEAKVPEVTAAAKGEAQYPVTYGYGQDFPLTLVTP